MKTFLPIMIIAIIALALCALFPDHAALIGGAGVIGMALQTAAGPLTDRLRPYDLVRWEPDQRYTRTAGTIKNTSGVTIAAGAITVGLPLKLSSTQWVTVQATDEANLKGLFLGDDSHAIPESLANNAITAAKYPILFRGPALVNKSVIPTTDLAGVAYTLATIVTALQGLSPPIDTLVEPDTIGTQIT